MAFLDLFKRKRPPSLGPTLREQKKRAKESARRERVAKIKEVRAETSETYRAKSAKTDVKNFGTTPGWQLAFSAEFKNVETQEERGPFKCFSSFHRRFDYAIMWHEAKAHGQSQAQGSYESGVGDDDWVMYNVRDIRKIKYNP